MRLIPIRAVTPKVLVLDQVVDSLVQGFKDEPFWNILFDVDIREQVLKMVMRARVELKWQHSFVLVRKEDVIERDGLFELLPDKIILGHVIKSPSGDDSSQASMLSMLYHGFWKFPVLFGWKATSHFLNFLNEWKAYSSQFKEDVVIEAVVVHPDFRQQGFGTLLIKEILSMTSHQLVALFTQNHRNVEFYQRLGFKVTHHCQLLDCDSWRMELST